MVKVLFIVLKKNKKNAFKLKKIFSRQYISTSKERKDDQFYNSLLRPTKFPSNRSDKARVKHTRIQHLLDALS